MARDKIPTMGGVPDLGSAPNVNMTNILANAEDITCDACGNYTFEEVYLMKHISALVSPNGKEGYAPIPVMACVSCGYVNTNFLPPFMKEKLAEEAAKAQKPDTKHQAILPEETPAPTGKPTLTIVR